MFYIKNHKKTNGGFGLQSTELTSPIAFACAFVAAHDLLAELTILCNNMLAIDSTYRKDITYAIEQTRTQVGTQESAQWVPPSAQLSGPKPTILDWIARNQSGAAHLPRKLQHVLAHASDRNRYDA